MATQQGFLTYSGKLGDTVGYRRGDKYFERLKPRSYQPGEESQKSGVEFGRGSTACVLLKLAFEPMLLGAFKSNLHNRLASKLREIIRMGPVAKKGERTVFDGDLKLFKGFEFNSKVSFSRLCRIDLNPLISAEEVKISIKPFDWNNTIQAPQHAELVKIGFCCVFVDFNSGTFSAVKADDLFIKRNSSFPGGRFKIGVPTETEIAVMLVMNVSFQGEFQNNPYQIENKQYQAGKILDVAHIKNGEVLKFVAEELPKKVITPSAAPDAFWELGWEEDV